MSNVEDNGITIEISGEENSGKTLVGCVIYKALNKAGFTNVTMTDQQGELVEPYDPRTVLDAVQATRPELFATRIGIVEVTDMGEDSVEVIELSDMTLRVLDPMESEAAAGVASNSPIEDPMLDDDEDAAEVAELADDVSDADYASID